MTDWKQSVTERVRQYDMLPPGSIVLCAVSGGIDSVFLLHLLNQLRTERRFSLVCAHYDHQLRGEDSRRDGEFVRGLCEAWDIPFVLGGGDVLSESKHRKQGIEETARQMRYAFLYETAERLGAERIAVGHNADDNTETLLLHLVRGCGLQGLAGMSPRQGALIRPLLTLDRATIQAESERLGLSHVEDASNADERFSRNRIRHQVLPALKELNPRLAETMTANAARFAADNDYLDSLAVPLLADARQCAGGVTVSAAPIAQAAKPLALRALRQLLALTSQGSTDCSAAHLESLLALCRGDDPSAEVHLPHGLTARREYDRLTLVSDAPPTVWEPFPPKQGDNPIPGTDWVVTLLVPPWPGLLLRPRQTGDELTLSNGHTRSLKRLCIDHKIPKWQRNTLPVAVDELGLICAAPFGSNLSHPHQAHIQIIKKENDGNEFDAQ